MMRLIVFLLALFVAIVPAAQGQALPTIRVSSAPLDTLGNLYYAQELGYFKDAGLDVEFVGGRSAPDAVAALVGGSSDVAASAVGTLTSAYERGIPIKLIAAGGIETTASHDNPIIVKSDSPYRTAADLNGKTIGLNDVKSMLQVAAMSWSDHHGGDSKTLKFVETPFPNMCQAVVSGRVDAATPVEPFATSCGTSVRELGNVMDSIAPRFIAVAYAASDAWLKANPLAATRFVAALNKASVWGNSHPQESAVILVKYSHLDPAVVNSMARSVYGTRLDPALIQPLIDMSVKYGTMGKSFPAAQFIWNGH